MLRVLAVLTLSLLLPLQIGAQQSQRQGLGQLIVRDTITNDWSRLEIARYHVNVVVQAPVALVQIDQSFFNPRNGQSEGTYVFNLPPGASVSRFAMYVTPDQLIEGELIDRTRARNIYDSIVNRRRDPAILEQIGDNLFRVRVFPIFGRDTKRILLDFTVPLEEIDDQFRFELPLLSDLKPVWDFKIEGTVTGNVAADAVVCPSHPEMDISSEDDAVSFQFENQHYMPPSAFRMNIKRSDDPKPDLNAYVSNQDSGSKLYFMATLPRSELPDAELDNSPTDLMVLVDTSMSGGTLQAHREAVQAIVDQLRDGDRIQLGCADIGLRMLTEGWQEAKSEEIAAALTKLSQEVALGSSRLNSVVSEVLKHTVHQREPSRKCQIIYIGDGISSEGAASNEWLSQSLEMIQEEGISFSAVLTAPPHDMKRFNIARDIAATGGRVFDWESHIDRSSFAKYIGEGFSSAMMVEDVRLIETEAGNQAELFFDPYWVPGKAFYVFGAMSPEEQLSLQVRVGGVEKVYKFNVEQAEDDYSAVFTGRLWAQRKLETLNDVVKGEDRKRSISLA